MATPDFAELAIWRYGIISRLLHQNGDDETLEEALLRLSSVKYRKLDGHFVSYSPDTFKKWFYRYRNGGLSAQNNSPRKDIGTHGTIPQTIPYSPWKTKGSR